MGLQCINKNQSFYLKSGFVSGIEKLGLVKGRVPQCENSSSFFRGPPISCHFSYQQFLPINTHIKTQNSPIHSESSIMYRKSWLLTIPGASETTIEVTILFGRTLIPSQKNVPILSRSNVSNDTGQCSDK